MNETELRLSHWRNGPTQAERLAAAVLALSGFAAIDPQSPLGGPDGRRDIVCQWQGRRWVAAVYFPTRPMGFATTKRKFGHDLKGATPDFDGIAFVTNQALTQGERERLLELGREVGRLVEIFHLERLRTILDSSAGLSARVRFLGIPLTVEDQIAWVSEFERKFGAEVAAHTEELAEIRALVERFVKTPPESAAASPQADGGLEGQASPGLEADPAGAAAPDAAREAPGRSEPSGPREPEENFFLLLDPNALDTLADSSWFVRAISHFYVSSAEVYGCEVDLSARRLLQAHGAWRRRQFADAVFGEADGRRDGHFADAGAITAELLRFSPINDIRLANRDTGSAARSPTQSQAHFMSYGNETVALLIGFYICLAYETVARARRAIDNVTVISDAIGVRALPPHFLSEYPILLQRESVRETALQMMYTALFDTIEWDVRHRGSAR